MHTMADVHPHYTHLINTTKNSRVVAVHAFNTSTSEFAASLVYKVSTRTPRATR